MLRKGAAGTPLTAGAPTATGGRAIGVAAAADVAYRAGTQKARLLEAFKDAYPVTLTDEEAAERAGISLTSEYSKRCGELRQDGAIVVVRLQNGEPLTRAGKSGIQRIVSIYDRERGA